MDDRKLISLLFERSEQAIPELKDRFGRLIRKVAVSVTGSEEDAEEIENDTYLALWERIPPEKPSARMSFPKGSPPGSWGSLSTASFPDWISRAGRSLSGATTSARA